MTNENDYPQKIKNLMEELRVSRDRVIQLDERLKREEKSSIQLQERMVQLEEKCRSYKEKIKGLKAGSISGNVSEQPSGFNRENSAYNSIVASTNLEVIPESNRFDELQRANLILMRAKESQYKKS